MLALLATACGKKSAPTSAPAPTPATTASSDAATASGEWPRPRPTDSLFTSGHSHAAWSSAAEDVDGSAEKQPMTATLVAADAGEARADRGDGALRAADEAAIVSLVLASPTRLLALARLSHGNETRFQLASADLTAGD
jgi:hypothetical protein